MKRNVSAAIILAAITAVSLLVQTVQASARSTMVEQRILTQEGLAIALASTVLQSQLNILFAALDGSKVCSVLTGKAGSDELISLTKVSSTESKAVVGVYFDEKCKHLYVKAHATITSNKNETTYTIAETATYTGPTGFRLGDLSVNEKAIEEKKTSTLGVTGLGQFVPANKAETVDLGLECTLPETITKNSPPFPCAGGIAQNFPKLSKALASVTPLELTLKPHGSGYTVSFEGSKSDMVTGAIGALSITAPTNSSLGIAGKQEKYGSAATKGSAANFSLFPPTPTRWSITDSTNDTIFSIAVKDDKTRASSGKVARISTGKILASFAVDQSGTGSITYSDGSSASITSWLLSE